MELLGKIRNFCIIAHIDHGKSTLADRFLELTGTIDKREMKEQVLDQMDLERERGITIKLAPVRMSWQGYELNLIDTPGHVDFSYEVSRSLAAVEGAILLVDATQGIQAQTLANLYLALDQDLAIIPVINKIDLPAANVEQTKREILKLLGCKEDEILAVSAKTGQNVEKILQAVIELIPAPKTDSNKPLKALVFDSIYDEYRGIVAYVRVIDGQVTKGQRIRLFANNKISEALEVGFFKPEFKPLERLRAGEIGYVATGFRQAADCRVGDTITGADDQIEPLPGYHEVKPMVFAGLFCKQGSEFPELREAIEKLKLSDAALRYEPEQSPVLGSGFRCGFLGLLHLDIVVERLHREYNLELLVTVPSVAYKIETVRGEEKYLSSPEDLPEPVAIRAAYEPWMKVDIFTPAEYIGTIMQLVQDKRGEYLNTEYLEEKRALLHYYLPLNELIVDFYDRLKSLSSGYASLNYEFKDYRPTKLARLDILVAEEKAEELSCIVREQDAYNRGRQIVGSLKTTIPKQWFVVKLQAVVGGRIIAAERINALRKDVTAKLYGGDVTRKRKLLEKQKKGKKKMMALGKVDIPKEAYLTILKR